MFPEVFSYYFSAPVTHIVIKFGWIDFVAYTLFLHLYILNLFNLSQTMFLKAKNSFKSNLPVWLFILGIIIIQCWKYSRFFV